MIKTIVRRERTVLYNRETLWQAILDARNELLENRQPFIRLIERMPERMATVYANDGKNNNKF